MRADVIAFSVAQFVFEGFGESLHAGLRYIIGGIAGRRRDALLGAGVDDEPTFAALDHARRESLRAVDYAPEIDAENPLPVCFRPEHRTSGLNAGIVHQQVRSAEAFAHGGFER